MSAGALTLLVLIASGDGTREASGPVATSMARAVRETLGADAQVIVRDAARLPSNDDALALARDLHAGAVAELAWRDPEHRRATLHVHADPSASRWTDREVGFDASDADAERGRMIGFALASMLPEHANAASPATAPPSPSPSPSPPPPPSPSPPPPPSPSPSPSPSPDSPETPEAPSPPGEILRFHGALDLAATGSLGGDATAIGGTLSARWDFAPALSLRVAGSIRAGDVSAANASSTIRSGALGVVWRIVPITTTRALGLAARADLLAIEYRLDRDASHATLWLPGADLAVEGTWMLGRPVALFAAAGAEAAFGATDVFLFSNQVTTISPVRGLFEAGIRVHF